MRLEALARAKINLFLHAGTRRPDGYHALASWVAFAATGDRLSVEALPEDIELQVSGPQAAALAPGTDNLVLAAAHAVRAEAGRRGLRHGGAAIALVKSLPVASGIGGGSADAAATLHLLNEFWELDLGFGTLMDLALPLGSDVPVCLYNRSAVMTGRGETIAAGPELPAIPIVLVHPGVPLSTANVFARLATPSGIALPNLPEAIADSRQLAAVLARTANDLEAPAMALAPAIGDALAALRAQDGALLARMSGSGATCFALFADDAAAQNAAIALKRARPNWWIAATRLDC